MSKYIKSITLKQLEDINPSLSNRIALLAVRLKENQSKTKSDYWITIDESDNVMSICADNGFDITESIEVTSSDREKILAVINNGALV